MLDSPIVLLGVERIGSAAIAVSEVVRDLAFEPASLARRHLLEGLELLDSPTVLLDTLKRIHQGRISGDYHAKKSRVSSGEPRSTTTLYSGAATRALFDDLFELPALTVAFHFELDVALSRSSLGRIVNLNTPFSMARVISQDRKRCQFLFCVMKNPLLYRSAWPESGREERRPLNSAGR